MQVSAGTGVSPAGAPAGHVDLAIDGMTCASCAARIEKKLNKLDGVTATVNFATETAHVSFPPAVSASDLISVVGQAGYTAVLPARPEAGPADAAAEQDDGAGETAALRQRLLVTLALAIPVVVLAMVPPLQFRNWQWASLALASPVVIWGAWPFHRAAFVNVRHGAATMDTLISVGVGAAYLWSLYALFFGAAGRAGARMGFAWLARDSGAGVTYLEVASGVTALILLGRYFEARAKRRSGAALRALLSLGARDVAVLRDGMEMRVPAGQLAAGEEFVVRPGEKIAADGIVVAGRSAVDTAMLTGEPVPAEVGPGDAVTGGCVNAGGRLVVRATRVGADTQLAQMTRLVAAAQAGKAPVQRLADRISAVFVPVVIAAAVVTLIGWLAAGQPAQAAFTAAVAVLIIACPCAMGLATPTAILVGTGRGAQLGIVINGPEVLESTRAVDTIVLDKTGTVTTGRMSLVDVAAAPGQDADELLRLAGAVEDASEHPVAAAIAAGARERLGVPLPAVQDFAQYPGSGRLRRRGEHVVAVGRAAWLESEWAMTIPAPVAIRAAGAEAAGQTAVFAGWDGQVRGVLVVADTVKPTSAAAVARLRGLGLSAGAAHRRQRARRPVRGRCGRDRRGDSRGAARRQGRRGQEAAGRRAGGGDGRRRRQRRRRARPGRPGPGHGHRHRRRDRGRRPHLGPRRPARRPGRDLAVAPDPGHDQGQPVLGVRLQRRRHPARGARVPQPADRGRGDGVQLRVRRVQQPAPAPLPAGIMTETSPGRSKGVRLRGRCRQ